jgi:N-acetyl-alpha-D-glucosaminyl L-malate synthase BshA
VYNRTSDPTLRGRFAEPDEAILIQISNFRPLKRIEDVIAIFAKVLKHCRAKLLMVGDGPERPKAEWLAATLGISDHVLFLGKQNDMAQLLSMADVMLFPSENESFGLVALEAMACEVPVITTNIGGIPEVVEHGQDGYLFNVGDTDGMSAACVDLIKNPERRLEMGQHARQHAQSEFCASKIVKRYEELYRQTLASAGKSPDIH